jgi:hypothetical protein
VKHPEHLTLQIRVFRMRHFLRRLQYNRKIFKEMPETTNKTLKEKVSKELKLKFYTVTTVPARSQ